MKKMMIVTIVKILIKSKEIKLKMKLIKKKILDDDKNTPLFDEKNKNNSIINEDMEFEKMKLEMISAVSYKKYTFEKNTIQEYRIINGNLIPYNIKK
jgi:hypothetical protein